jgi:hypothetical protein
MPGSVTEPCPEMSLDELPIVTTYTCATSAPARSPVLVTANVTDATEDVRVTAIAE